MKTILIFFACILSVVLQGCHDNGKRQAASASFEELSEEGRTQWRKSNYMEGMTLLLAARDSLAVMNPDSVNPEKAIKLIGNISNMYKRMGLYDESKQTNTDAMKLADEKFPRLLPDLWRMRGALYTAIEKPDSQIYCMRRALEACERVEDDDLRSRMEVYNRRYLLFSYIEHSDYAPDSIPIVLKQLEKINYDSPTDRLMIGRAYVILGDYKRGIPKIEKAIDEYRQKGDIESVQWGLQLLAKSYVAARDPKLLNIYDEVANLRDSLVEARTDNRLLGMDFKYRTSQLKHDKEVLQSELRAKRQRIEYLSVIAIMIVIVMIVFIIMRNKNNKRQLRLKQQNIETLLAERIALNSRIEELNVILSDNKEPKRHEMFQTVLLEKEDEKNFRKSFNDIHPGFIDRMRREYPDITPGNELLCMLIALNRRNNEIALALGISRESVATSRYRLRNRFNLSKDTDLNDFIQSKL